MSSRPRLRGSLYPVQLLMRGPNVPDPRNPDTIRKSHSTVALTRQAIQDGAAPRLAPRSTGKAAQLHDSAAPVADIKVDAPGEAPPLDIPFFHHLWCIMHSSDACLHHRQASSRRQPCLPAR